MTNELRKTPGRNMRYAQMNENKGYTDYRDFARQELNDGYRRNPAKEYRNNYFYYIYIFMDVYNR